MLAAWLEEGIAVRRNLVDGSLVEIEAAAAQLVSALAGGGKVLLLGNGGSAADAQHVAAELVGRFGREGAPLPAVALTVDTSILTAVGNDYGFDQVFARQVQALARPGDVVFALSTSGDSPNVLAGATAARDAGVAVVGLTGANGGALAALCDVAVCVPSSNSARIQEAHIAICHALCEVVDSELRR